MKQASASAPKTQSSKASTETYNGYLVRATPASPSVQPLEDIPAQVSPFHFQSYGNEGAEIKELKARLGWKTSCEVGKFYDSLGSDKWYYFVYGDSANRGAVNEVASRVCHAERVRGDVVVIRSGPVGTETPEKFSRAELCRDLAFYRSRDAKKVFTEREQRRMLGSMGLGPGGLPSHIYTNQTSGGGVSHGFGGSR